MFATNNLHQQTRSRIPYYNRWTPLPALQQPIARIHPQPRRRILAMATPTAIRQHRPHPSFKEVIPKRRNRQEKRKNKSHDGLILSLRDPHQKQSIGIDVFPITDRPARHRAAVPPQQTLQLPLPEPPLPLRRLKPSPMVFILINNDDPPTGLHHPAKLGHCALNIHRMFQRFRRVQTIERPIPIRQRRQRSPTGHQRRAHKPQHRQCNIHPMNQGPGVFTKQHAGKPPLSATRVQNTLSRQIPKRLQQHPHMQNTRINRRRKMLLIRRRLLKRTANSLPQIRRKCRSFRRKQS